MLSLGFRQMLPPKMPFFVQQKCKFCQTFCHKSRTLPMSSNFVKNQYFRHDAGFSSSHQFSSETKSFAAQPYLVVVDVLGEFHLRDAEHVEQIMFNTNVLCKLVLGIRRKPLTKATQQHCIQTTCTGNIGQ